MQSQKDVSADSEPVKIGIAKRIPRPRPLSRLSAEVVNCIGRPPKAEFLEWQGEGEMKLWTERKTVTLTELLGMLEKGTHDYLKKCMRNDRTTVDAVVVERPVYENDEKGDIKRFIVWTQDYIYFNDADKVFTIMRNPA